MESKHKITQRIGQRTHLFTFRGLLLQNMIYAHVCLDSNQADHAYLCYLERIFEFTGLLFGFLLGTQVAVCVLKLEKTRN
jgi:hypothetical protein